MYKENCIVYFLRCSLILIWLNFVNWCNGKWEEIPGCILVGPTELNQLIPLPMPHPTFFHKFYKKKSPWKNKLMVPCFLEPFLLSTILSRSSHIRIYNVLLSKAHPLQYVNCILQIWKPWIQRPLIQWKFRKQRIWHHEFLGKAHPKQE